jgi:hypothetical protein
VERFAEATWLPATSNAGPWTGGAAKGLLHTTEGGSFAGALSVYRAKGYWPHATLSFEGGRFQAWQHLDLDVAGKALEHPAGTAPTNTDHVVQVEIVGSAVRSWAQANRLLYVEDFPTAYLAGISRWMRYVEHVMGVQRCAVAPFGAPGTVRRLTVPEWHGTSGWVGHCHVPNNSHSDPGAIDIRTLLANVAPTEVKPMYQPALVLEPVVADLACPTGGAWCLSQSGAVYAWGGAPNKGGANGRPYFAGRTPARLELPHADQPDKTYVIVATSGERYAFPE